MGKAQRRGGGRALQAFAFAAALAGAGCSRSGTVPSGEVPPLDHVVVVVMENHTYDQVREARYLSSLIAGASSFSDAHAVSHPSLPNYLALWSGSTLGVTNDDCPPAGAPYSVENLGHACEAAGLDWKAYSENLPVPGSDSCAAGPLGAQYTRKHAPWTYFSNLHHTNEVSFAQLGQDVASRRLPRLAFVVPHSCHDMHDCAVDSGDVWLARTVPSLIQAVGPRGLVIVTWDEDNGSPGNHILTLFAGPRVKPGYVSQQRVTHYSVLRTICLGLGLPPFGAAAHDHAIRDVWTAGPPVARTPAKAPVARRGADSAAIPAGKPSPASAGGTDAGL